MARKGTTQSGNAPSARRRTVLKLLAGSIAGAGLSSFNRDLGAAAQARAAVGDAAIGLEFDASLHSRVLARRDGSFEPLTDFEPSETLRLADGRTIDRFAFLNHYGEGLEGNY